MTSMTDLLFDRDLCVGVASHLARTHQIAAVVDDYEIGMAQVRIDPTNPEAMTGFVACPGTNAAGQPAWGLLSTTRVTLTSGTVFYDTAEGDYGFDLWMDLNAPIDAVAAAIATHLSDAGVTVDYAV